MFQLFIEINHNSIPLFLMSLLDVKQQLLATSAPDSCFEIISLETEIMIVSQLVLQTKQNH